MPLCIILPQMSGWIKYFENGGKNMSFKIEDDSVYLKYNGIWNKTRDNVLLDPQQQLFNNFEKSNLGKI